MSAPHDWRDPYVARRHHERQIARMGIATIRVTNRLQPWVLTAVAALLVVTGSVWGGWL